MHGVYKEKMAAEVHQIERQTFTLGKLVKVGNMSNGLTQDLTEKSVLYVNKVNELTPPPPRVSLGVIH